MSLVPGPPATNEARMLSALRSLTAINPTAFIHPTATVIGRVTIGPRCTIWPNVVIRGDVNKILIGKDTNIQDGTVIHCSGPRKDASGYATTIGDRVSIGHMAMLHGCTIEDDVLIGMKATVMDGAVVPQHTIIGAGALVPPGKILEPKSLYVGSPAKRVRPLTQEEIEGIKDNANIYIELRNQYMEDATSCTIASPPPASSDTHQASPTVEEH